MLDYLKVIQYINLQIKFVPILEQTDDTEKKKEHIISRGTYFQNYVLSINFITSIIRQIISYLISLVIGNEYKDARPSMNYSTTLRIKKIENSCNDSHNSIEI